MPKDLVVNLTGRDNLSSTIRGVTNSLNDLKTVGRTSLEAVENRFKRIQESTAPLKVKLKQIQAIMAEMNMSGLNDSDVFSKMAIQAGQYKDAIADAQQSIGKLSSDTLGIDATLQGFSALTGAIGVATGAMTAFGASSEDIQKVQTKIQGVIAMVNGMKSISDAFNKDSSLMNYFRSIGIGTASVKKLETAMLAESAAFATSNTNIAKNTATKVTNAEAQNGLNMSTVVGGTAEKYEAKALDNNTVAVEKNTVAKQKAAASQIMYAEATDQFLNKTISKEEFYQKMGAATAQEAVEKTKLAGVIKTETNATKASTTAMNQNTAATNAATASATRASKSGKALSLSLNGIKTSAISAAGAMRTFASAALAWIGPIMAVVSIGYLIYDVFIADSEAADKAAKAAESLKAKQEALKKRQDDLTESAAKANLQYLELATQWKNLQTAAEKDKWIKDNASNFKNLGINITTAKTAEDVFVKNTDKVISALLARAIALKKAEQAAEDYINLEKKQSTKSVATGDYYKSVKAGQSLREAGITQDEAKALVNAGYGKQTELTEESAAVVNRLRNKAANEKRKARQRQFELDKKQIVDNYKEQQKIIMAQERVLSSMGDAETKPTKTTTPKNKEEAKYTKDANTIKKVRDNITVLQKQLESLDPHSEKFAEVSKEIKFWKKTLEEYNKISLQEANDNLLKDLEDIQGKLQDGYYDLAEAASKEVEAYKKIIDYLYAMEDKTSDQYSSMLKYIKLMKEAEKRSKEVKLEEGSIAYISKQIQDIEKQLNDKKLTVEARIKLLESKFELQKQLDNLSSGTTIKADNLSYKDQVAIDNRQAATEKANNVITKYEVGIIGKDEAKAELKRINQELQELDLKPIDINIEIDWSKFDAIKDGLSQIGSAASYIGNLDEQFQNCNDAFDYMATSVNTLVSAMELYQGVVTAINTLQTIFGVTQAANNSSLTQGAAASTEKVAADSVALGMTPEIIAANTAQIMSYKALTASMMQTASAGYMAAHAYIPFAGFGIGAGYTAAAMATVKGAGVIGAFADGGIVGGSSLHGDRNMIAVNGQEMILNGKQQRRLFNILDGNGYTTSNSGGTVEFKISGRDLKGVLKNYDNKMSKL